MADPVSRDRFPLAWLVIVIALVIAPWLRLDEQGPAADLVSRLEAQAVPSGGDLLFYPVGNQDVRKFVFLDKRTNQIHIYGGNGKFEETWQIGSMGQDLRKQ